jgi:hypothetical protein
MMEARRRREARVTSGGPGRFVDRDTLSSAQAGALNPQLQNGTTAETGTTIDAQPGLQSPATPSGWAGPGGRGEWAGAGRGGGGVAGAGAGGGGGGGAGAGFPAQIRCHNRIGAGYDFFQNRDYIRHCID